MSTYTDVTAALQQRHDTFIAMHNRLRLASGPELVPSLNWPAFWDSVNRSLLACGYRKSTRRQYRGVLRALRQSGVSRPAELTAEKVQHLLHMLVESGASWSWIALHISAIRIIFDRLCCLSVTAGLVTPKRPERLPEVLGRDEADRLVRAGTTIRDQLLLGLLYGCGLTGSEAARLRWGDVLNNGCMIRIEASTRYVERTLPVPDPFRQLLRTGAETCAPDEFIFRGRSGLAPISTRMIGVIVRLARERADIERPVSVMTLRHSYAVYRLESGASLRQVQQELGHASIRTTERYRRCLPPVVSPHPFTKVRAIMARCQADNPTSSNQRTPTGFNIKARPGWLGTRGSQKHIDPNGVTHCSRCPRPLCDMAAIDIKNLTLPFAPITAPNRAAAFLQLLKSRLLRGILRK